MDKVEYEFPDEKQETTGKASQQDDFEIEIEDDTPTEDRGKEPLPQKIVEELEQDELEDYSEKVKTRLKQMKKVWHDERREKDQARREQQEAIEYAKRILEENKSLKNRLSDGEKTYLDTYKTAAEMELDNAKRSYKEAYDAGDTDRLVDAQEKITNANYKLQKAREYVPSLQNERDDVKDNLEVQVPRPDPRAAAWQERNTWFGQDEEMTSLALGLHQKLVKQHGTSYTSTDEYWSKVDDTMRRRFPDYFQETTPETGNKPAGRTEKSSTVVAPATRSTGSKKILLKQSQLSIAKKLGLTPEQYVREMMKMEAKNG
jgi:chromosome segregation ATPase